MFAERWGPSSTDAEIVPTGCASSSPTTTAGPWRRPPSDLRQAAPGHEWLHDEAFNDDDDHVVRTLTKILDEAAGSHRKLDPAEELQDAQPGHRCAPGRRPR